jgi:hypothetical protein
MLYYLNSPINLFEKELPMSVEKVVHDFIARMGDKKKAASYLTSGAAVDDGVSAALSQLAVKMPPR